jgi:hypothetical protein
MLRWSILRMAVGLRRFNATGLPDFVAAVVG